MGKLSLSAGLGSDLILNLKWLTPQSSNLISVFKINE
uniref:Uncharacterized protein n=1 Tax=Anguilla anguilla TaxID=7936 RepID=A0A0E9XX56_ANGAN